MSGFLASLAARSIGREPVLAPRRLLFEPQDDLAVEAESAPAAPDPRPAPRDGGELAIKPPAFKTAAVAETRAEKTPPRLPRGEEIRSRPPPASDAPEPPPTREAHRRRRRGAREPAPTMRRAARAAPPAALPSPAVERTVPAPSSPVRVPARAALAGTPPEPRPRRGSPAMLAAGEHVVRITIGRVDVRAEREPAPPPPRPRPAPPRMTLAEYLARGRGS